MKTEKTINEMKEELKAAFAKKYLEWCIELEGAPTATSRKKFLKNMCNAVDYLGY